MKLLKYYLEILFPLPLLYYTLKYNEFYVFVIIVIFYSLFYRQLIDGYRLFELKIIEKVNYKVFNPFYMLKMRIMHFSELYFLNK